MKKIVLISTYFGKLPNYFNLWLKSAAKNESIDFLIYSDCDISEYEQFPENVKIIKTTFDEMRQRIQSKFDFKITLDVPYKMCDFKPAYAFVFEEDIKGYDYWGHIDIDTILGDIQKFLPKEDYDKIYQFGHLCIYRNTEENNRRFMLDGGQNYRDVFTTSIITVFDEFQGMQKKFDILKIKTYLSQDCADITKRLHRFTLTNILLTPEQAAKNNYDYQIFYYEDGSVFRDYIEDGEIKTQEFNYIHFSSRKMPDYTDGCDSFYITNSGFYPKRESVTREIIERYNPLSPKEDEVTNAYWRKKDKMARYKKGIVRLKELF